MGGGALKVEAADLRTLPVPIFDRMSLSQLEKYGRDLSMNIPVSDKKEIRTKIDEVVIQSVTKPFDGQLENITSRLEK